MLREGEKREWLGWQELMKATNPESSNKSREVKQWKSNTRRSKTARASWTRRTETARAINQKKR